MCSGSQQLLWYMLKVYALFTFWKFSHQLGLEENWNWNIWRESDPFLLALGRGLWLSVLAIKQAHEALRLLDCSSNHIHRFQSTVNNQGLPGSSQNHRFGVCRHLLWVVLRRPAIFKSAFMEWAPSSKHKAHHRPPSLSRSSEFNVSVCFEPCWYLDLSSLRPSSQTCLNGLKHKSQPPTATQAPPTQFMKPRIESSLTHKSPIPTSRFPINLARGMGFKPDISNTQLQTLETVGPSATFEKYCSYNFGLK